VHQRYASAQMLAIWSDERRYERWREVELAVLHGRAEIGEIGPDIVASAEAVPAPTAEVVAEAEAKTRHDLVAFLQTWTDGMPPQVSGWVHRGLTSSDIVDTALSLIVGEATDVILAEADGLVAALRDHALAHMNTARLGRTHGMAAAPDVWGHRVADFAFSVARCRDRLRRSRIAISLGKISGPVGTYAGLDPRIEEHATARLGLNPAPVATQVLPRDCLAEWMFTLSALSTAAECVALEIRHGQRFEVAELAEPTTAEQSGSSAMPHKRNPVLCEKVCGLARVVRSLVLPVTEGMALWHERDISHSSVERVCLPDAASLTDHILRTMRFVIENLYVDAARMRSTLNAAGAIVASDMLLSILIDCGLNRSHAYELLKTASRDSDTANFELEVRSRAAAAGVDLPREDFAELAVDKTLGSRGLAEVFERLEALT
jgi:adenylosuccinate lyase